MTAYTRCKYCRGRGCLACDGERKRDQEQANEPLFVAKTGSPEDMELLLRAVGADAVKRAYGPNGGKVDELKRNLLVSSLLQSIRDSKDQDEDLTK